METKNSVTVPINSLNGIIDQLKEREDLIFQKIIEIEKFREKTLTILILGFLIIFFLSFLNIYFIYRWKRAYILLKKTKEKILNSQKKDSNQKLLLKEKEKNKKIICQRENCLFYYSAGNCNLIDLGEKIINFSQKINENYENKNLKKQLLKMGVFLNQNCYFHRNILEKESFLLLKQKLKKVRYNLNKIKKNKKIDFFVKKEAYYLWHFSHQITLKIINFKFFFFVCLLNNFLIK